MNTEKTEIDKEIYYIILEETTKYVRQTFDAKMISEEELNHMKNNNFSELSSSALKNNQKIFIIEAGIPLIKIIPECTIVNNCF
jgi:hypothetical protein